MNELPQIVRARLNAASAGDHPDPDLLTAFAEKALMDAERKQVLTHLSKCADCREILALASSSVDATTTAPAIDTATGHSWFRWHALRWGMAAACIVIVGSAVMMKRNSMMSRSAQNTVAVEELPLGDQRVHEPTGEASPSTRQDADIRAALQPPRTKLTAPERNESGKKLVEPKRLAAAPAPGVLKRKLSEDTFAGGANAGLVSNLSTPPPQPSSNAATTPSQETNKFAVQSRNAANLEVPASSEAVQAEAATPTVETHTVDAAGSQEKQEALGKAKPSSAPLQLDRMADAGALEVLSASGRAKNELEAKERRERVAAANAVLSRWTISSDGQLQHSIDAGKTWQPVVVAERATFRALSANGPDIWVGGPSGLLYHSADSGAHWKQVKPSTADTVLTADIAAIEFTDLRQGKISTANGEIWLTGDAGRTWSKQP
jgi:photosynthesis system II assembly factor YCF48-like protein/putative zinc finger protein